MDVVDQKENKWKMFKQRLGLKGISCCGASWSFKAISNMDVREEEEREINTITTRNSGEMSQIPVEIPVEINNLNQIPASGVNLATALAAEREYRAAQEWENGRVGPTIKVPLPRVSLIRLLEETSNGVDEERESEKEKVKDGGGGGVEGNDSVCCVCMGRKKGAAFIPCGHTFCRVCSREIWLNRGCCPLCNRSILEILDIF
ncbi:RING/U-box superfamily protein [Thalictrum thalictroides]|uniref:RING/U-box superfamily protein n=1 Tax=Thalictrum thalictroides TaxID=46969 RepID=A0A7J6UVT5_THATH|nr:RING/U-box superfamily protein [Thalictrum thalictroides]